MLSPSHRARRPGIALAARHSKLGDGLFSFPRSDGSQSTSSLLILDRGWPACPQRAMFSPGLAWLSYFSEMKKNIS
jgi:hypothetical protein